MNGEIHTSVTLGLTSCTARTLCPRMSDGITADRKARVVAHDLNFPNGMAITPDGRTMIMAEFFAQRLTAFDIEDDGSLTKSTGVGVVRRGTHREGLQRNAGSSEHRTGRNFP